MNFLSQGDVTGPGRAQSAAEPARASGRHSVRRSREMLALVQSSSCAFSASLAGSERQTLGTQHGACPPPQPTAHALLGASHGLAAGLKVFSLLMGTATDIPSRQ